MTQKKKTWITAQQVLGISGLTYLDGFDVLKLHTHRLQARQQKRVARILGKNQFTTD